MSSEPMFQRAEDHDLLTGRAEFVADLSDSRVTGAAHAVFVRSPFPHAEVVAINTERARTATGVLAVLTVADNPPNPYGAERPSRFQRPLLAGEVVRFVGEAVAVVVAETMPAAVDAAELVEVDFEPLTPTLDPADSTEVMVSLDERSITTPRSESVMGECEVVASVAMRNPRQSAVPLEPRGAVSAWDGGRLLHWESTQRPHRVRDVLARMYGLTIDDVRVVAGPFVGGGFGGKGMLAVEALLLPELARLTGRPVRWIESRTDYLQAAPQGRSEDVRVDLGGTADGTLEAIRVEITKDGGAYQGTGADLPAHYSYPALSTVYDIPVVEFDSRTVATNKPPIGALRGAGRAPMVAAVERAVDEFAAQIGVDPAELRRRNLLRPTAMPFTSPTGGHFDEADYPSALESVLKAVGYEGLRHAQTDRRSNGGELQLGIGLASYNHRTNGAGPERAVVTVSSDGSASVVTGTTSQGHGHSVTWATLVERDLGIPADQVLVVEGDTDLVSTGVGAIGSRSVQTAGVAIHAANAELIDRGLEVAAGLLEAAPIDMTFEPATGFHVRGTPARSVGWREVATQLDEGNDRLRCEAESDPNATDVYPSGCHLAVVEVDTQTGMWWLRRYVAADDVGNRIAPMLVEGQLHGGISMGVGQVFGEEVVHDADGNPLTSTFLDYQIPSIDQFCQFELLAVDVPSSFNPGGYKAVGESGPIGATPAVHNAVIDAVRYLGVHDIPIPCTPQRVWREIVDASGQHRREAEQD